MNRVAVAAGLPWFGLAAFALATAVDTAAADRAGLVRGNTAFACELFAQVRERDGNLCFSPYSISTAMAMLHGGARGETAQQIAKALHFDGPITRLHPAARNLADALGTQTDKAKGRFQVGNAVWVQQHFGLADTFRTLVRTHYAAEVREVDFMDEAEAARNTINQWVAGKTADKIPTLLGDHALAADTRLVLTSTLYLKADWLERFSQGDTADGIFHLADGKTVTVPLMQGLRLAPYFDEGTYEALALPFDGKRLSMVVLLPKMKHGLGQLEKALSGEQLTRVLARLRPASVEVALPRFSVAGKADLAKALTALGLGRAFSNADFSGIATAERLSLDKLIHEVHVDVNEEGVEASAATAVPVKRRSLTGSSDRTFRADRPFLFLIRDDPTGCLLFLGRVADPQKP